MNKRKLKKGDNVLIIAGKDRGKRGSIEHVFPGSGKVTVVGVNIAKHHLKPSRKNPQGGIVDKLTPIDISNCIIICPRCGKPTKVGMKITPTKKIRICRKCKESLDQNV